jgi:DNA-binding transcriptional regulator YiaG
MQYDHLTRVGRFTVIDVGDATETLSDGSSGITSEELARLERRAAITVLSEVHEVEGAELKFARKALGLSQPELALLLGVTTETVCRWETGKEPFKRQTQLAVLRLVEDVERNGESTLAKAPKPVNPEFTLRARAS